VTRQERAVGEFRPIRPKGTGRAVGVAIYPTFILGFIPEARETLRTLRDITG
jgi:hypothetical protein